MADRAIAFRIGGYRRRAWVEINIRIVAKYLGDHRTGWEAARARRVRSALWAAWPWPSFLVENRLNFTSWPASDDGEEWRLDDGPTRSHCDFFGFFFRNASEDSIGVWPMQARLRLELDHTPRVA